VSTRIIPEFAVAVDAKAVGLAWVAVAVAAAVIIVHCLVFSVVTGVVAVVVAAAVVAVVSDVSDADDIAIVMCRLAFSVAVGDAVVVAVAGVGVISCREAVVAEGAHTLSEVFVIIGDLKWGKCVATAAVADIAC